MSSESIVQVVKIETVRKHENADALDIIDVFGGYPCIVRRGSFAAGDKAAYVPVDMMLPLAEPRFSFLKETRDGKHRLKASRLRGVFSMGLLVPANPEWEIGQDVTAALGCEKYEPPVHGGENEPDPGFMPVYTDIEGWRRFQNEGILSPETEIIATEKIHGANGRYCFQSGRLWCGSRTSIKKQNLQNLWWAAAQRRNLSIELEGEDFALYGEVYGQVQDLKYGLTSCDFVAFDALHIPTRKYLDADDFFALVKRLGIPHVPILYRGPLSGFSMALAEGQTLLNDEAKHIREGVVFRPVKEQFHEKVGRVIFKVHGEGYLTRK